jgi:hypothetical protein
MEMTANYHRVANIPDGNADPVPCRRYTRKYQDTEGILA